MLGVARLRHGGRWTAPSGKVRLGEGTTTMIHLWQSAWLVQHTAIAFTAAAIVAIATAVVVIRDLRKRARW